MTLRVFMIACILAAATVAPVRAADVGPAGIASTDLPAWTVPQPRQERYLAAHGLRGFAGGYSEDGLEIWTFPLQIAAGYAIDTVMPDGVALPALGLLSEATVDPLSLTRVYQGDGFRIIEQIDTREQLPGVRVRFRVEGDEHVRIRVRLRPSLNLMWPAGFGGQEFGWDQQVRGFLLKEPSGKFRALIASMQAIAHTQPNNDRRGSEFGREISMELKPARCGAARCATLVFAGQSETGEDAVATVEALRDAPSAPAPSDAARFATDGLVRVTTPDADANRALRWAQIALEQAWTCNARLGCGLVAGYGPSHGSRRPQYAWYFGGDGLVATRALIHSGAYARAAQELDFILRYQHPDNGMIWHEMSHSAGFLAWARDYPYMYSHVDIAFDFLVVLAEYARASGGDAFVRRHWPAVMRTWRYCLSTLDASDGLPRVPADKMSQNEQDKLTDELILSAGWVRAAHAMSQLANGMGDPALAATAEAASERARASVRTRYRDHAGQRWISGFARSGKAGESRSGADMAAIASGAATREEAAQTLDTIATPAYLTAWGLRSKPTTAQGYDPEAYSAGSVWGLGSATAAEALWQAGRGDTAWHIWNALVDWSGKDSVGHMHELMSGSVYTPQRESVPEQIWSSAAFLSAMVGGMLGLHVDANAKVLRFAPQPPPEWNWLQVQGVRVGSSRVDLRWQRDGQQAKLEIHNTGPALRVELNGPIQSDGERETLKREVLAGRTMLTMPLHVTSDGSKRAPND